MYLLQKREALHVIIKTFRKTIMSIPVVQVLPGVLNTVAMAINLSCPESLIYPARGPFVTTKTGEARIHSC